MKSLTLTLAAFVFLNTYLDGQCLSGDCTSGVGTLKYENGDSYTGEWENSMKEGYGRYDWADGSYYVGYFKSDMLEGEGTYTATDGSIMKGTFSKGQYVEPTGCIEGNCFNGKGTYILTNGDKYTGDWVDGYRTGYGRYDWADGSYYEGYFKENKLEGEGSYYGSDGTTKIGKFDNGNYIEGSTLDKKDDDSLDDLIDDMNKQNAADDLAKKQALETSVKKDFCSVVQDVVNAFPQNFESLLGDEQKGYLDFGNSWYSNLMVENSVSAGISGDLLTDARSFYNVLYEVDDLADAQSKYNSIVSQMNSCRVSCCTFVYDTHDYKGDSYQSSTTYWIVFTINDGYSETDYEHLILEVELMSNVIGPKWSIVFRAYELDED